MPYQKIVNSYQNYLTSIKARSLNYATTLKTNTNDLLSMVLQNVVLAKLTSLITKFLSLIKINAASQVAGLLAIVLVLVVGNIAIQKMFVGMQWVANKIGLVSKSKTQVQKSNGKTNAKTNAKSNSCNDCTSISLSFTNTNSSVISEECNCTNNSSSILDNSTNSDNSDNSEKSVSTKTEKSHDSTKSLKPHKNKK